MNSLPRLLATEYANFRHEITLALISELSNLEKTLGRSVVLFDPMAGTAPLLPFVELKGHTAYFNDLNTLHLFVNQAKRYCAYDCFRQLGEAGCLTALMDSAPELMHARRLVTDEWIDSSTLDALVLAWRRLCGMPSEMANVLKGILLLSIRDFSSFAPTSNPTWFKPGGMRRNPSTKDAFETAIRKLAQYYQKAYQDQTPCRKSAVNLLAQDAACLVLPEAVDVIATSPPFCNRVDWDRLYAPEHFFLDAVGFPHCKTSFVGTTAVKSYEGFEQERSWLACNSPLVDEFLVGVKDTQIQHERKSDYYVRYFTRYFFALFQVFENPIRSLVDGGGAVYYAVQDNSHRGQLISLREALSDFFQARGFEVSPVNAWHRHHLGLQNVSRRHRIVRVRQVESLMVARR